MNPDVWTGWGPFYHFHGMIWAKGAPKGGDVRLFDVRAWGFLTGQGHGAIGLPNAEAAAIQDHMGDTVAELMNEKYPAR